MGGRVVHSLTTGETTSRSGSFVVIVPGLGLPFYTLPTARAVRARGLDCAVLDLPGFGSSRPWPTSPNIHAVGMTAARWVESQAPDRPVVVLGHSTGAQAALTAGLALSAHRRDLAVVLAGPTFAPRQRRLLRLAVAAPFAYSHDSPYEINPAEILRGWTGIIAMLHSGLRDAAERRIAGLPVPLTLTAGADDSFAPLEWLDALAQSACSAPRLRTSLLSGSHNNLYTHPDEVADLVVLAAEDAAKAPPP
ncbi:alpha/beta fold hydrolase [Terrabacter sp. 2RAF25]|uniref:alpha/beta fold hydrolase n=1 Tax=Terrabacter sp. 2RAF25 TaxID=3232998 RepID=UPI003F97234D